ncbi:MAG TPA: ATP-binding protein [Terriglobales bacterium]|nr:ATP-binding protein [Terriglobales bacterium]
MISLPGDSTVVLPNTAILFLLSGIAVLLLRNDKSTSGIRTVAGRGLGLIVGAIGLLTVFEHLFHLDFGIDTLFFLSMLLKVRAPGVLGRFAIQSAMAFACAGFSLLFLDKRYRGTSISEVLAGGCAFISFLGLVGYAFGVPFFHGDMALETNVIFAVLSFALFCLRPQYGLMSLIVSDGPGGVAARNLLFASTLVLTIFGWARVYLQKFGVLDVDSGTAVLVVVSVVAVAGLVLRTANQLEKTDHERRRAEREQLADQERTARLLESISEGFVALDHDFRFVYVNERGAQMLGRPRDELIGKKLSEIFPDYPGGEFDKAFQEAVRTGKPQNIEAFFPPLDNWFELHAYPSAEGLSTFFMNVTERRKSQELIRIQNERVMLALRTADAGMWDWELPAGRIHLIGNEARLFGFPAETADVVLDDLLEAVHPDDRRLVERSMHVAIQERSDYYEEFRVIWPDGSTHHLLGVGKVFTDQVNRPERMVGVNIDVTQSKLGEEALRKSEKLAATGRLAATVAHEINNPLEAVMNLLYLLQNDPSVGPGAREYLTQAEQELSRVAHLTRQTLGFYRDSVAPTTIDLAEEVRQVMRLYERRAQSKGVVVEVALEGAVFHGFPGEVKQVVSNLLTNAIDAAPMQGVVKVSTKRMRELAVLRVEDNGPGIPEAIHDRLFEAFFSTKKEHGTGLGLWVSKGIVEKHGGSISFRTATRGAHTGTVFEAMFAGVQQHRVHSGAAD